MAARKWADIRIDAHYRMLNIFGRCRYGRAGYTEIVCGGADGHDLGPCEPPCNVCDSGRSPRCPDCGASV